MTTLKNAAAFSQSESQRPAESHFAPFETFDGLVYKAKLLAHLRAVLSDKSLTPHQRKVEGQSLGAQLRYKRPKSVAAQKLSTFYGF